MADHTLVNASPYHTHVAGNVFLGVEPAVVQIMKVIGARLTNITTANGYYCTAKKIERARLTPWKGYDLPCINYWCTTLNNERTVYNDDNRTLEVFIEIHDITRDDPFVDVASRLAADVVTALNRTTDAPAVTDSPDYDLGEMVQELIFGGHDFVIGEGQAPWCGALVRFIVKWQCDPNEMMNFQT
jgi:hypothetical protein